MKKIIALLMVLCMTLSLAACGSGSAKSEAASASETESEAKEESKAPESKEAEAEESKEEEGEKKSVKIGFAISSYNSTAFQALADAMQAEADKLGIEYVVSNADNDSERQIDQMQDLVTQGCDAIIVNPVDSDGIVPVVEEAMSQGVKILAVDRLVNTDIDYTIATDNYAAGVAAGEYCAEIANGEEFEVLLLTATPSVTAIRDRQEGFKDTVTKKENLKIVGEPYVEVSTELVYNAIIDAFKAHPNIKFIYGAGDAFLPAMQSALIELGKQLPIDDPGHVYLSTCDGEGNALDSVDNGTSDQCVCQMFTALGTTCLNVAYEMCNGKDPETKMEAYPVLSYTRETKDSIDPAMLWGR